MVQQKSDSLATLNNSQEYHRSLWEVSPSPQFVHQLDGTVLDANQAFANLIGRTVLETLGLNIWSITPANFHHLQAQEQTQLEQQGKFEAERAYLDLNKEPVAVKLSGVKLELEGNNLVLLTVEKIDLNIDSDSNPHAAQSPLGLQAILDKLPFAIFWKNTDLEFLGCNKKFAEVTGVESVAAIVGKTDYDLDCKKEEADWYRECDRLVLESGIPKYNIIEPLQPTGGSQRWLRTNKMVLRDGNNNIVAIAGTFEDITERIELEKQLKEQTQNLESLVSVRTQELSNSKARFEKLLLNVPGAIYQFKLDLDGKFSFPYISSDCEEIFELTALQMMEEPELFISEIHPEDMSNFEQVVQTSAQTLAHKYWEGRVNVPSGKTKWIQTASKPEKQDDGSIVWDGLVMEVSDRKQAEHELRDSQQLLRLIFDTLPQRIFWKDNNLNYLGCNRLFAQDAGLNSPEEIIGKSDFDLSWHKSASLYRADDEIILAGGTPKINYEETQVQADGSIKTIRTNKLPLKDKHGSVISVFGSYEDISNINQQKQQTDNAKDFIEKAFDSISSPIFVKDTNHCWVFVNDAYCKFVGFSKSEILGKSEPDFFSQEQADIYWAKDELVMLSGEEEIDEEPFTDGAGNNKLIVTKKSCFSDLDGNTFLLGMIIDIYDV